MHKYKTGGEVGNRMSNVIVKENESLDSALRRFKGTGIWCFFSAYIKPNATKGVLHEEETKRSDC